jgi:hypothetical protein
LTLGRPRGSRNKVTAEVRRLLDRLTRDERISPARVFARLEQIALSDRPDAVPAARVLLSYLYGLPTAHVALEHGLSESATDLLIRISQSDEHRRALAEIEQWRDRRRVAIEVRPSQS